MENKLPNIKCAIVGAYKAGTTSLKNYLGEHPNIATHVQLEFDHFKYPITIEEIQEKIQNEFHVNSETEAYVIKHVEVYRKPETLKRLSSFYPDILYVFIVRKPVQRAYSAWKMEVERSGFKEPFEDLFDKIENDQKDDYFYKLAYSAGLYGHHYKGLLNYVKEHNIMLVDFDDLINNPQEVCNQIFERIGVSSFSPNTDKVHNSSKPPKFKWLQSFILFFSNKDNPIKKMIKKIVPYKMVIKLSHSLRKLNQKETGFSSLDKETARTLQSYYEQDIQLLESLSGKTFPKWRENNNQ